MHCTARIIYLFFKEKLWRREQLVCVSELHEFLFSAGFSDDASDGKAASSLSDFPEFLLLWDRELCVIQEQTMNITHIWVNCFKDTHTHTHEMTRTHPTFISIPAREAKKCKYSHFKSIFYFLQTIVQMKYLKCTYLHNDFE